MCEYYVKADPIQYEQRSRTIRIRGVLTTIRLENSFWDILAEMAEQEGCTTNSLITMFHDEIIAERGEIPNFASFLRVTCVRYLRRTMMRDRQVMSERFRADAFFIFLLVIEDEFYYRKLSRRDKRRF